jgi:N-acetylneuraminic acid mutarotase
MSALSVLVAAALVGCGGSTTAPVSINKWTWMSGSTATKSAGIYGTKGVADAANVPGARYNAASWNDSGNLWMFGGVAYPETTFANGESNDLWRYSVASGQWTWMSGSKLNNASPTYGTLGVAGASNVPGARDNASSWTDGSGNLWLFGGNGYDSVGNVDLLNDLWKYNIASGQWTWVSGSNVVNVSGNYGTMGVAAGTNVPGARSGATTWTDNSGNLWLMDGSGYDAAGANDTLNDLWKYNIATNRWTWMSGSTTVNGSGSYGTKGVADVANVPPARYRAAGWADGSGNLWLLGGFTAASDQMNDLWKYSIASGQWTWMSGDSGVNSSGVYGAKGVADASNVPGARAMMFSWTDATANLWLFGGSGYDGTGAASYLNDLWKYNTTTGQWTWVSGENTVDHNGIYGTKGTADAANAPGARLAAATWFTSDGKLWLMGGSGFGASGSANPLNDLWMYAP